MIGGSVHVQYRLAGSPAVQQCLRRFGHLGPRRPQANLRIELAGREQFHHSHATVNPTARRLFR